MSLLYSLLYPFSLSLPPTYLLSLSHSKHTHFSTHLTSFTHTQTSTHLQSFTHPHSSTHPHSFTHFYSCLFSLPTPYTPYLPIPFTTLHLSSTPLHFYSFSSTHLYSSTLSYSHNSFTHLHSLLTFSLPLTLTLPSTHFLLTLPPLTLHLFLIFTPLYLFSPYPLLLFTHSHSIYLHLLSTCCHFLTYLTQYSLSQPFYPHSPSTYPNTLLFTFTPFY